MEMSQLVGIVSSNGRRTYCVIPTSAWKDNDPCIMKIPRARQMAD